MTSSIKQLKPSNITTCSEKENYAKAISTLKQAIALSRPYLTKQRQELVDFYVNEANKTMEGL